MLPVSDSPHKDQLHLQLGVGLSAEQMAALTHDIVWLEEVEVNGEKVLAPVVYLAQAEGRLAPNGALIQGRDVTLVSGGDLHNVGTLYDKKKGDFGRKETRRDEVTDVKAVGSQISSGGFMPSSLGAQLAVRSALNTVVNGGKFRDNVAQAAISMAADALSGAIFDKVGDAL
ncbi:TPA: DUF637 domain-containing protein, partial [Pseudomonas aeruginosa]|nr:DUF637 domain-containing protein [Pseudomonas aeruginosa]HCH7100592.1 DUF637 domain-containing protein [Pseudomonas aeruginosa]